MLKIQKTVPALLAGAFLLPAFTAQAQVATTTSLTSSENPSHVSDSVTFTATVSSNGGAAPTGSVQFTDFRTSNQVSVALTPGAGDTSTAMITFATIDPGTLQTGTHGMQANYQPTGNFGSSVGSVIQQVIADGVTGTTTTLISSQNPSASGQSVTFTATVSADSGTTAPTGTVSFLVDGTTASTPTLQTVGGLQQATFTTSSLTVAPNGHNITAIYNLNGGNASFAESSASLTQTVSGTSVTFTATVTGSAGGTPSGTVTFVDITTSLTLGGGPIMLQPGGTGSVASVSTSFAGTGTHNIVATYNGDPNFSGSSGSFSETVNAGTTTTTTVTSSPNNPSTFGQTVTFTATVSGGGGTPTGTVTFTIDGTAGSPINLVGGAASTSTSTLTVAGSPHIITAAYSGDATFSGSTSAQQLRKTSSTVRAQPR